MIGFLLFDDEYFSSSKAEEAITRLNTYEILKKYQLNNVHVFFIKNQYGNNYIIDNENILLCITGTFIFGSQRGSEALRTLYKAINKGKKVIDIYKTFRGNYTLIHLDKVKELISVYVDKEGLQNSFISKSNDKLAVSSNLLLLNSLINSPLNMSAVREFIHYGTCLKWKTIFKQIYRMKPATALIKENELWRDTTLWKISVNYPFLNDSTQKIIKTASDLLEGDISVASNIPEKKILIDLTGGSDSRTILSFLLNFPSKITASTAGPDDHIDVILAKKIAQELDIEHFWWNDSDIHEIDHDYVTQVVEMSDGCISPFSLIKSLPYYQERAKKYDIVFGGNGGPLSKDHYWLYEFNQINKQREPNWNRIVNLSMFDHPIQDNLFANQKESITDHVKNIFLSQSKQIHGTNNQKLDYVYFTLKCPDFLGPCISLANQFFDVYQPLINGEFIEYMINIRPNIRKRNNLQFSMILNNNPQLAWIDTDNGYPAVPSRGRYFFLVIFILWRFFKAFLRKFYMLALKKSYVKPVYSSAPIAEELKKLGYFKYLQYENLAIRSIISQKELSKMLKKPYFSSNLHYLLNILAIELFYKHSKNLAIKSKEV